MGADLYSAEAHEWNRYVWYEERDLYVQNAHLSRGAARARDTYD